MSEGEQWIWAIGCLRVGTVPVGWKTVSENTFAAARQYLEDMRDQGVAPPSLIAPAPGGEILIEWRRKDGVVAEIEVCDGAPFEVTTFHGTKA